MEVKPTRSATYFLVAYLDRDMRIPKIETYICVGQDLSNGDWYFQTAESFAKDGLLTVERAADDDQCLCLADQHVADGMLTWDRLVDELQENKTMQDRGMSLAQKGQLS